MYGSKTPFKRSIWRLHRVLLKGLLGDIQGVLTMAHMQTAQAEGNGCPHQGRKSWSPRPNAAAARPWAQTAKRTDIQLSLRPHVELWYINRPQSHGLVTPPQAHIYIYMYI